MEELMKELWSQFSQYIYAPYLLTFIFLSYTVTRAFGKLLQKITKFEWKTVYTVLVIATVTAIPFIIWTDVSWIKILFTYSAGTTLYEIAFKFIGVKTKE
jgi:hypothetical protein